jgi:hypothetical protein
MASSVSFADIAHSLVGDETQEVQTLPHCKAALPGLPLAQANELERA